MTTEDRSGILNGIWLCQTHAKLIDDDEIAYPASRLREFKETAEHMAALEAKGYEVRHAYPFAQLERKAPKLIAEMRENFKQRPLVRQFVLLRSRRVSYHTGGRQFVYFYEDHESLDSIMTIMQHDHAIYDAVDYSAGKNNPVPKFNFTEEFVRYLIGDYVDRKPESETAEPRTRMGAPPPMTGDSLGPYTAALQNEIEQLKAENAKLKAEIEQLKAENAKLKAENAKLKAENAKLKAENAKLKERIAGGATA